MSAPSDPQDPRPGDGPPSPDRYPEVQQGYPAQFPSYPQQYSASPQHPQYGPAGGYFGGPAPQPGSFPLRPLSVGEILGAALRIARGHGAALVVLCLSLGVVANLLSLGLTALSGPLSDVITGQWAVDFLRGRRTGIPRAVTVNLLSGLVFGLLSFAVTFGVATAIVARSAIGRPLTGIVAERLSGRWPTLLGVSALVSVLCTVGLFFFIVPGVLLYLAWVVAMPVAVMERSGVGQALRRSVELTRGHRGRIFGTLMAWFGINFGAAVVVSTLVQGIMGPVGTTSSFVVQLVVTVLVSALFQAWLAAIVAVIYVDLRIRKENLAPALAAAAAQPVVKPAG